MAFNAPECCRTQRGLVVAGNHGSGPLSLDQFLDVRLGHRVETHRTRPFLVIHTGRLVDRTWVTLAGK